MSGDGRTWVPASGRYLASRSEPRVQTDFASRCDTSLAEYERTGVSIPAAQVIAKLESKRAKRRKQLGG